MEIEDAFDRCLTYLDSEAHAKAGRRVRIHKPERMAVAMSRQTGSGAIVVAHELAEYLHAHEEPGEPPWTVFDQNLLEKVLEDHHLPARLAKFLPEDRVNSISDTVDEILGLHPPSWLIVHQSIETILRLAEVGHVILVGRGANAITSRLPNVLRVRLVGSLERRVARIEAREHLSHAKALAVVRRQDRGRARYVKKYLHKDISDPLLYDLIINTDHLSEEEVVRLIGETVLQRLHAAKTELVRAG